MPDTPVIYVVVLSYLLGSIPFGLVLTKLAGLGDIRQIGSGNIGATNVLRTGKKGLAALTLLLDGLKGSAAVFITHCVYPEYAAIAGLAAMLGHLFPIWLTFKGGKGVATAIGVITALSWPVGVAAMLIWILVAWLFDYSSLAALVSIGLTPIAFLMLDRSDLFELSVVIVFLVFWKHSANIRRLLSGTETKIGK